MKTTAITIVAMIAVLALIPQADAVISHEGPIHFDRSTGVDYNHVIAVTQRADLVQTDYQDTKQYLDQTGSSYVWVNLPKPLTTDNFHEMTVVSGFEKDLAIFSSERFNEFMNKLNPRDESAAPHLQGFNTRDADRVFFGCAEDVVYIMSNTEIHILNGKTWCDNVYVYFDGWLIDIIPVTQNDNLPWIGIGGEIVKIPFEFYYHVDDEGHLYHLGSGYQHVFRDLASQEIFNEDTNRDKMLK